MISDIYETKMRKKYSNVKNISILISVLGIAVEHATSILIYYAKATSKRNYSQRDSNRTNLPTTPPTNQSPPKRTKQNTNTKPNIGVFRSSAGSPDGFNKWCLHFNGFSRSIRHYLVACATY